MSNSPASRAPFSDRSVIVTGGGNGLGAAYCEDLARRGARVMVADIDEAAAAEVAQKLQAAGHTASSCGVDVSNPDDVERMAQATDEAFDGINVLINNAAVFASIPISRVGSEEITISEWDHVMGVNVKGVWLATRAVVPFMRDAGYGKIVNISSGTAFKGSPIRAHYVASKAAVLGLTRSFALEFGKWNICVNAVAPGSTLAEANPSDEVVARRTRQAEMRALSRIEMPKDLAGAIAFLSGPESDFITGQTLVVDGGSYLH